MPHLRQPAGQLVGQHDRQRHERRGLVAGEAEEGDLVFGGHPVDLLIRELVLVEATAPC